MSVTADKNGQVVATKIGHSSNNALFGSRTEVNVQSAAPYFPFAGEIRQNYAELVFGMCFSG